MMRALAIAVFLVACSDPSSSSDHPARPIAAAARPITPRTKLPASIQPLLPRRGIYTAGGGSVSPAWRVIVDLDGKTIYGGSASRASAPSFGPMDKEQRKELSPRNQELLIKLAQDAWAEPAPSEAVNPTADYDEIFVVVEGDDAFFLQGFGPIRRPLAAKAIVELRAAAGL